MTIKTTISVVAIALSTLLPCTTNAHNNSIEPAATSRIGVTKQSRDSQQANQLFEAIFMENVMASPIRQTELGIKTDYGKWDELGKSAEQAQLARDQKHLQQLQQLKVSELDTQTQLSFKLLTQKLQQRIADHQWRLYNYPVNQMYGSHSLVASFLINQHQIQSIPDAQAYISRLNAVPKYFAQLEQALEERAQAGIIAPKFVFAHVLSDSRNIIDGAPFNTAKDSAIWADFKRKLERLELSAKQRQSLLNDAQKALTTQVKPAYQKLIAYITTLEQRADDKDGVWKFKHGEAFYNNALARTTTTAMSAETIHQLGLTEVERIHQEMHAIMEKVGFEGDLNAFFQFMRSDKQFYYADTESGRKAYLKQASSLIDNISARLDEVFNVKPKAAMIVKRVEAFREKSAGKAFYNQPSPDGSRPGTYYANLYDMQAMPKYQLEALAYHEGTPGHHMQIAIAQELQGVPKFRKFGGYTAYIEGWGLYSEYFPKEMGLYSDPYSDFGRLAMELWRSCRLVVDTGIHAKRWTREQAINYYMANTPNAKSDAVKMVERHIVMPSQATAYKIGMLKIIDIREKAKQVMGDKFDIKAFHTLLLKNGPLPLDVLEEQIIDWANNA
ncbi:DUF885 domain-containing protein [Shewanella algidipiscicola]|nr:DUF885 domain-containing protein [Shewanella algidipiscicola]